MYEQIAALIASMDLNVQRETEFHQVLGVLSVWLHRAGGFTPAQEAEITTLLVEHVVELRDAG